MGQLLHNCARTTTAVRRAIQHSQESLLKLAERYDLNPKTVQRWRKQTFTEDAPMESEGALLYDVEHRRRGHGLSQAPSARAGRLPLRLAAHHSTTYSFRSASLLSTSWHQPIAGVGWHQSKPKKKVKAYPIGYYTIDRTFKVTFARLVERATRGASADFLQALIKTGPYKIPTILSCRSISPL